uniref:Uncharacterized protein LOC102801276 n=1 Tax=Saccoglossus kowalevskii TaxID=10224 RepID=A0ABM0MYZ4_SACKO|nr:PREDICTED: uncharacterized protein LOC102801276 [Saccoglossus kowalevskii]
MADRRAELERKKARLQQMREEKKRKEEERKRQAVIFRELTEEEKKQIIGSEEFVKFFDRTSRVVERALSEEIDLFTDYTGGDDLDKEKEMEAGAKLALHRQFYDERWSKHRVITSMDWSTQYPELLMASYNSNEEAPHEPDGVALIWNMKYKKNTPEYIFHCQSAVMSSVFARFHPNLIVGGTYSGQIVLWDNRSNKRTPVQRTPLSAAAHTKKRCLHKEWLANIGTDFKPKSYSHNYVVCENHFTEVDYQGNQTILTQLGYTQKRLKPDAVPVKYICTAKNESKAVLDRRNRRAKCDGRCDSPVYSAKYGTYTIMEQESGSILDFQVVQSTETGSSVRMEKEGCKRSLEVMKEVPIPVATLATDRQVQIRSMISKEYPEIQHQFDVWHFSKSIK